MKFSEILASVGLAPKTLDQAKSAMGAAQPALNSVAALFTAASLDLDAMLAAGPDSLKAHIESLSAKDGELATAQEKASELQAKVETLTTQEANAKSAMKASNDLLATCYAAIGFDPASKDAAGLPVEFKAALSEYVTKEASVILAKDGRPPLPHETTPAPHKEGKAETKLTGRDRYQADFNAQLRENFSGKRR